MLTSSAVLTHHGRSSVETMSWWVGKMIMMMKNNKNEKVTAENESAADPHNGTAAT